MADVTLSGPVFDGRAERVCAAIRDEIERDLAQQAYADVMTTLNARIQNPTPYYETQVTVTRLPDGRLVHDRGIVYGPWLEGTSARNRRTRFRGYHAFALARAALTDERVRTVGNRVVRRWLAALS